ncbi:MAG: Polyketide cyclase / dehydrase and lipid transport [Rhodospirillales bacterium]|jgi:mxaD protein|nr:Polyketide cyclase / dehydrase and lipid transport [Rhodospirillales bacterium]
MASVDMSIGLNAPAEKVWALIGGFADLPRWHPAFAKSEVREGGKLKRRLTLQDGASILEQLDHHDDATRTYSYTIVTSPLPIADYRSELSVRDDGPGRCTVRWKSTFEPEGAPRVDAEAAIRGVYQGGFDRLAQIFAG